MNSSNVVKICFAFLIGVVLALGSALVYVRLNEMPEKAYPALSAVSDAQTPSDLKTPSPKKEAQAPQAVTRKIAPKPKMVSSVKRQTRKSLAAMTEKEPAPVKASEPAIIPAQASHLTAYETMPASTRVPVFTPPPIQEPHVVTLQAGMSLAVRLGETLASNHNDSGDTFRATLESPIIMDGFVIADRGSQVLGRVTNVQTAGRVQGVSELTLALTEINTTDGQKIRIRTNSYTHKGVPSTGADTARIAGGAALGALIGAIAGSGKGAAIGAGAGGAAGTGVVLATRGKPTILPTETPLTFRLSTPVIITEQFNQ